MLAPRAWKRIRRPAFKHSRLKDSNCQDCGRSSLVQTALVQTSFVRPELATSAIVRSVLVRSVTEVEDPLHGALVGLERVTVARDGVGNALEKAQCGVHVLVAMKRHKAAGKEFCDHLAGGEPRERVAVSVFENEDSLQRGALG